MNKYSILYKNLFRMFCVAGVTFMLTTYNPAHFFIAFIAVVVICAISTFVVWNGLKLNMQQLREVSFKSYFVTDVIYIGGMSLGGLAYLIVSNI